MTSKTKKCPFCAETIKAEAIVCRYCGRDLPKESESKSHEEVEKPKNVIRPSSIGTQAAKISGVLTAIAILGLVFNPSSTDIIGTILFGTIPNFLFWWAVSYFGIWLYRKHGKSGCAIAILIIIGLFIFGNVMLNSDSFSVFSNPTPTRILKIPTRTPSTRLVLTISPEQDIPLKVVQNCIKWNEVTSAHVYSHPCVYGIISGVEKATWSDYSTGHENSYTLTILYFTESYGDFYIIIDDSDAADFIINKCYVTTSKISTDIYGVLKADARDGQIFSCTNF